MPLAVGDFVKAKGFVTNLMVVINKDARTLERALGFREGRLERGWVLLALKEAVAADDIELAGTTLSSGGKTVATTANGVPLPVSIDQASLARSTDIDRRLGSGYWMQKRIVVDSFHTSGSHRIVKIVPVLPHIQAMPEDEQYPRGAGVFQCILRNEKTFVVAAVVERGRRHIGGGAGSHPVPGHWVSPDFARTV